MVATPGMLWEAEPGLHLHRSDRNIQKEEWEKKKKEEWVPGPRRKFWVTKLACK